MCFIFDFVHWLQAARSLLLFGLPVFYLRLRDNVIAGPERENCFPTFRVQQTWRAGAEILYCRQRKMEVVTQYGCALRKMLRAAVRCVKCFERLKELCYYRDVH